MTTKNQEVVRNIAMLPQYGLKSMAIKKFPNAQHIAVPFLQWNKIVPLDSNIQLMCSLVKKSR